MPKRKTILQADCPYHISARCINREWFELDMSVVWNIMSDYLFFLHHSFEFRIYAFVLMNNHFHAIVSTPKANMSEGMNYFMREVSRNITFRSTRINQTFGGPYHWCILDSYHYFLNAYKYIYRNPVEAGMTDRCEDYEWSTLGRLLGSGYLGFPMSEDTLLFDSSFNPEILNWLNTSRYEDHLEIRKALKKPYFRYGKNRKDGVGMRPEDYLY